MSNELCVHKVKGKDIQPSIIIITLRYIDNPNLLILFIFFVSSYESKIIQEGIIVDNNNNNPNYKDKSSSSLPTLVTVVGLGKVG